MIVYLADKKNPDSYVIWVKGRIHDVSQTSLKQNFKIKWLQVDIFLLYELEEKNIQVRKTQN